MAVFRKATQSKIEANPGTPGSPESADAQPSFLVDTTSPEQSAHLGCEAAYVLRVTRNGDDTARPRLQWSYPDGAWW